jgi:hypothetical protein
MKRSVLFLAGFFLLIGFAGSVQAEDEQSDADQCEQESRQQETQFLFVQSATGVKLKKNTLTLKGVSPTTVYFSDRPKRIAGHMTTKDFVEEWQENKAEGSFRADPPNATLSVFTKEEIIDVVVELKNPRLKGKNLIYDIAVIGYDEPLPSGEASLFIDPMIMRMHRRHARHRRHAVRRHH